MRVTVLGSGLVGGAIAKDLAMEKTGFVRAVDRSTEPLAKLRNLDRVEVVC